MVQKIVDWLYLKYGIQVPKLDVLLFLIIIAGAIILLIFFLMNSSGGNKSNQNPLPATMNQPSGSPSSTPNVPNAPNIPR